MDFGRAATVLSAWNGRGKSTLLGSIEWALFGELRFQPPENRTRDELVSLFHPGGRATVELRLGSDGQEVIVHRERVVGRMLSDLAVTTDKGTTLEAEDASNYLFRFLGLSFDDFYRAAFLHQDSIRGLLTEEQRDRDEALDRLFGVETIRNILTAIPLRPVTSALEEVEDQERKLMDKLSGAGEAVEVLRKRALQEAEDAGFDESDLTFSHGQEEAQRLSATLREVSEKYGGEPLGDLSVGVPEDLERVARRTRAVTKEIRLSVGKSSPLDAAIGRLAQLKKWRSDIEGAQTGLDGDHAKLTKHEEDHGKPDKWRKETGTLEEKIRLAEQALHVLDVHGRVIADAIAYLEAVPAAKECPVCGDPKEAQKLGKLLRTKIAKDQAETIIRLNDEIADAKQRNSDLSAFQEERSAIEEALTARKEELEGYLDETWNGLGRKGPQEKVLEIVKAEQLKVEGSLEKLRDANVRREEELQSLDDGADKIRILQRFLKAEADFQRVREKASVTDEGGSRALEEDKRKLQNLREEVEGIIKALSGLAAGRAQDALTKSGNDISRTYARLCNHPYFDGLKIEVSQKQVQGVDRNTYRIIAYSSKDGKRTFASSRLSTAQMNCVALSAYLSLAKVLSHHLGFMMMDDPSQNLDSEHKKALAAVIKELLPSVQVVIGTHDAEFDEFLRNELGKSGVAWFDLEWKPGEGTALRPYAATAS